MISRGADRENGKPMKCELINSLLPCGQLGPKYTGDHVRHCKTGFMIVPLRTDEAGRFTHQLSPFIDRRSLHGHELPCSSGLMLPSRLTIAFREYFEVEELRKPSGYMGIVCR